MSEPKNTAPSVCRRVLVVTNLWPSEAEPSYGSFVEAQMESLRPLGVDFDVLFINGRSSRWNYARSLPALWRRLRKKRYDLIHAHFGWSGWIARCQFAVPVVVSFMGDDVLGRYNRAGRLTASGYFLRASSFLLARIVSAVIVKTLQMRLVLRLRSAHVIPNGVDLALFRPLDRGEARKALGLSLEKKFVIFPFDPAIQNKRYDLIAAAVEHARQSVPELEILHARGEPHSRMPLYLNAADVFVLASMSEGSPNSIKEAMAVNLPVITVKVGDAEDLIGSTDGCFLASRDAESLASKIIEICRRGRRTTGRGWIARFSSEKAAEQIVSVYDSVPARGRNK